MHHPDLASSSSYHLQRKMQDTRRLPKHRYEKQLSIKPTTSNRESRRPAQRVFPGTNTPRTASLISILTIQSKSYTNPPPHTFPQTYTHSQINMKTTFLFFITLAATARVLALPAETNQLDDADKLSGSCYHPSSCSMTWSGKCEDYCGNWGFSHMSGDGCGVFSEKCCCSE